MAQVKGKKSREQKIEEEEIYVYATQMISREQTAGFYLK